MQLIDNSVFQKIIIVSESEYQPSGSDPCGDIKNTHIRNNTFENNTYSIDFNLNREFLKIFILIISSKTMNSVLILVEGYGARVTSVSIRNNIVFNNFDFGMRIGQIYGYANSLGGPQNTYPLTVEKNILIKTDAGPGLHLMVFALNFGGGVSGVPTKIANNIIYNKSRLEIIKVV